MNNQDTISPQDACRNCPSCDLDRAATSMQTESFLYGSGKEQVELKAQVEVLSCPSCGEQFTIGDAEQSRHRAVCLHLGRLPPNQIKSLRKTYQFSQEEFAQKTGFGLASIKRWESGSQIQNLSSDNLLRLLSKPENMAILERSTTTKLSNKVAVFRTTVSAISKKKAKGFTLRNTPMKAAA